MVTEHSGRTYFTSIHPYVFLLFAYVSIHTQNTRKYGFLVQEEERTGDYFLLFFYLEFVTIRTVQFNNGLSKPSCIGLCFSFSPSLLVCLERARGFPRTNGSTLRGSIRLIIIPANFIGEPNFGTSVQIGGI